MIDIDTVKRDDRVVIRETKEAGRVERIDLDDNVVYVAVLTANGTDTIDVDPADLDWK